MDRRNLFLGAALLGSAVSACAKPSRRTSDESDGLAAINNVGTLRVGFIPFPPAVIRDPNTKEMSGHFVDTIGEIAKQAGWKLQFVASDWATFAAGLDSGRFDLSIAPTFVTVPRAKSVAFSVPLFFAGNSAVVRAGERRFSSVASLDQPGVTIAVTQGEAGHEYARTNFHRARLRVLPGPDQSLTLQEVASGRADVALGDAYAVGQYSSRQKGRVVDLFADHPYNLTPVSWAVTHKQLELLRFIDASIQTLDIQGKLVEFERKAGAQWLHLERHYVLTGDSLK